MLMIKKAPTPHTTISRTGLSAYQQRIAAVLMLLGSLNICACGQKGPLYLPTQQPQKSHQATQAAQATKTTKTTKATQA